MSIDIYNSFKQLATHNYSRNPVNLPTRAPDVVYEIQVHYLNLFFLVNYAYNIMSTQELHYTYKNIDSRLY